MTRIRVLHLITGLNIGGAETALARLVLHTKPQDFDQHVISLIPLGEIGYQLREHGVSVQSLNMPPGRATMVGFLQLMRIIREIRPDILQTWLYHADLLGLVAGNLAGVSKIAWNIRSSHMDFSKYRRLSGLVVKICAILSAWPNAIVVNSYAGLANHQSIGYHPRKWEYIPNGVDVSLFYRDREAGRKIRAEWGLSDSEKVIGAVGRLDPQKNHSNLLKAFSVVSKQTPQAHLVCVGSGPEDFTNGLKKLSQELGLENRVTWAGTRQDMAKVFNAFDFTVLSSSYGEGFPNVLAESMACGVPCITTDVGDSARIAGETGWVVTANDLGALATALQSALDTPEKDIKSRSDQSQAFIEKNFSLSAMINRYENLYRNLYQSNP